MDADAISWVFWRRERNLGLTTGLYMYPGRVSRQALASRRVITDPYNTSAWCNSQTGLDGNDLHAQSLWIGQVR